MAGTAEQEERAKWRANERADRAEAELARLRAALPLPLDVALAEIARLRVSEPGLAELYGAGWEDAIRFLRIRAALKPDRPT